MKQTTLGSSTGHLKRKGHAAGEVPRRDGRRWCLEPAAWRSSSRTTRKAPQGRPPHPLPRMLRIYSMQQWLTCRTRDGRRPVRQQSMRRFAASIWPPTWCRTRRTILPLLPPAGETTGWRAAVRRGARAWLQEKKLLLKSGPIVDATIIAAPPSTKNAAGERDPEMKQTRKGRSGTSA